MNAPQQVSVVLTPACGSLCIVALTTLLSALVVHLLVKANAKRKKRNIDDLGRTFPALSGAKESHGGGRAAEDDDDHKLVMSSSPRVKVADTIGDVGEEGDSASTRRDEKRSGEHAKEGSASSSENGERRKNRGDDDASSGPTGASDGPESERPTSKSLPSPSPSPSSSMTSEGRDREGDGNDDDAPSNDRGRAPSTKTSTTTEMKSVDRREQQTWRCACEQGFLPAGMLRSFGGAEAVFRMSAGQCYHKR